MRKGVVGAFLLLFSVAWVASQESDNNNMGDDMFLFNDTFFANETYCPICTRFENSTLKDDGTVLPLVTDPDLAGIVANCNEWQNMTQFDCHTITRELERQCCTNFPPRYACEAQVKKVVLEQYDPSTVPLLEDSIITVLAKLEMNSLSIFNHGVNGGSVASEAVLQLRWKDGRLSWDEDSFCASSVLVPVRQIWIPSLGNELFGGVVSPSATVRSDGTVFWRRQGSIILECEDKSETSSKVCSLVLQDGTNEGEVLFKLDGAGTFLSDAVTLPEYKQSKDVRTDSVDNGVRFALELVPERDECSVCSTVSSEFLNVTIEDYPEEWLSLYNETEGFDCWSMELFLNKLNASDDSCEVAHKSFEETCCDERFSNFECERNIHEQLVADNSVTPPDPAPQPGSDVFTSPDMVDVLVNLDFMHFVSIDVQENTLRVLVSLQLEWYDPSLQWQPFIGGCQRVSYRASLDAEQTEIWVPEIELINLVEGVRSLPDGIASARFDGFVRWRRTGIVEATCSLSGIENFPFDETSCSLEFGGTRDPLFHRVNYVAPKRVQYGEKLNGDSWNFQEYKVDTGKTRVSKQPDTLSGFDNEIINFEFTFDRARTYYVDLFVVLYVIFTYMAFAMLVVDRSLGEKLGYGSSILFVLVAQDITLGENAPVTQETLWIFKFSFWSKLFVVYAILHSIVILLLWSNYEFDQENSPKNEPIEEGDPEEMEGLLNTTDAAEPDEPDDRGVYAESDMPVNGENDSEEAAKSSGVGEIPQTEQLGLWDQIVTYYNAHTVRVLRRVDYLGCATLVFSYSLFVLIMFTAGFAD